MICLKGCRQRSEASLGQSGEGSSESCVWQDWRWQRRGEDQIRRRHSSGEIKTLNNVYVRPGAENLTYCVVCPFHWMFATSRWYAKMPNVVFLKLWWAAVDKQPISFISKLFTRFTRHPELQDITFSSWLENPLPFHRCCKKKKKLTVIEDWVSLFSKLQSATGSFTFHLDWLNSCLSRWCTPAGRRLVSLSIWPERLTVSLIFKHCRTGASLDNVFYITFRILYSSNYSIFSHTQTTSMWQL